MQDYLQPSGWSSSASPFHAEELAVQERLGVRTRMDSAARRGIRDYMPDQHREFFGELPFLVLGGLDTTGQPWATLRTGAPGFIAAPDSHTLQIGGQALPGDPLTEAWHAGAWLGGLGIQPQTRRRNRVNGVIKAVDQAGLTVTVSQSFGNCAKYIQRRAPQWQARAAAVTTPAPVEIAMRLSAEDRALLTRSDTFFVASANTSAAAGVARGVDVSHRGGRPGFIRVDDALTLTTPDFSGNLFFNTLGNLMHDPRAGLLVLDFDSGDVLYLAVRAEIIWDGAEVQAYPGAQRLVRFHVQEVRRSRQALPFQWSPVDYAPQFAATDAWQTLPAPAGWRKLKLAKVEQESPEVRSFYLEAVDGRPLAAFEPGQFLPIRLAAASANTASPSTPAQPLVRTYTLSDAYHPQHYRLTVKRAGLASNWLHDQAVAGMELEVLAPGGAFTLAHSSPRPVVLLSAGIGITPMIAMLNSLLPEAASPAHRAPIYFIHGARQADEHPFTEHLAALAAAHPELAVHLLDSAAPPDTSSASAAALPSLHRHAGRVEIEFLKRVLPFGDYDFYLCGPAAFMQQLYQDLRALNIADERIRFEAFGPASVVRDSARQPASVKLDDSAAESMELMPSAPAVAAAPVAVTFSRSQRRVPWSDDAGSLLDLAEAHGVTAPFSCRAGACGTCSTRLLAGQVRYPFACAAEIAPGHALLCCAIPVADPSASAEIRLDL